jgi:hypothetical protein
MPPPRANPGLDIAMVAVGLLLAALVALAAAYCAMRHRKRCELCCLNGPGPPPGRLSALSVFHSKSVLVWRLCCS